MGMWKRWQDWASLVLGVLLFISPFVFNGMSIQGAQWAAWVGGALLVVIGLWDLARPDNQFGEWLSGLVGVLIFVSPWVLGFTVLTQMAWSAWIVGVLAVVLAAWVLFGSGATQRRLVGQH
jgi:hypothetical protein